MFLATSMVKEVGSSMGYDNDDDDDERIYFNVAA